MSESIVLNRFGEPARQDPMIWVKNTLAHAAMAYQRGGNQETVLTCKLVIRLAVMALSLRTARDCWRKKAVALKEERDDLRFRLEGMSK